MIENRSVLALPRVRRKLVMLSHNDSRGWWCGRENNDGVVGWSGKGLAESCKEFCFDSE